ncbi:MAG: FAD-binding protein, partial [Coxiellaceae bacterium]|nr:FAD-binding protein [Coxiellaceae bacterium]
MKIQKNISLQPYNTFNIDAKAARFFTLNSADDLNELQKDTQWQTTPKFILGGGSNILLTKDYPGLVIYNQLKGITTVDENNEYIWLKIAAGENWHQFVMYCVEHGYGGVENLSLIPGTVGAAPMQNIGAYGVEIRSVFESLDAIELATGKLKTFNNADCQFDYRQSIFKTALKNQFIITHVTLKLNKKPELNTHYGAIKDVLKSENKQP